MDYAIDIFINMQLCSSSNFNNWFNFYFYIWTGRYL